MNENEWWLLVGIPCDLILGEKILGVQNNT